VCDCRAVQEAAAVFGFPRERGQQVVLFPWGVDLERFAPRGGVSGEEAISGQRSAVSKNGVENSLLASGGQLSADRSSLAESEKRTAESDERFALRSRLGWQGCFVALSLRSWEPIYGVDVIVRGVARAMAQEPRLRLILLGGGSLAGQIQGLLAQAGLHVRVHLGGRVSNADLPRYYQAADLYLSASHSDGSSVSLLEALASGLPVLVSDIPGNREWVEAGKQGWLFPDGDAQALAEGLLRAAGQPDALVEMGAAARQLAESRANWSVNFQKLILTYQTVVSHD